MSRRKISFEDLAKLAQKKKRTPCGKKAYSKSQAGGIAKIRNQHNHLGQKWFVVVCYSGCGNSIWHLTTTNPSGKKNGKFNRPTDKNRPSRRNRKKRNVLNRRAHEIMSIGTWEGEGGALHPRDLED